MSTYYGYDWKVLVVAWTAKKGKQNDEVYAEK